MADSKISALPAVTSLDGTELVPVVQGGTNKQAPVSLFSEFIRGVVATDFANSTVTPAAVTDLNTSLTPGAYNVKVWMLLRAAAAATGIGIHLNASGGTVTHIAATWYTLTTDTVSTTTPAGVMDQASVAGTHQVMEGRAQRANNTTGGVFAGVDTAAADQFAVLEGIVVVTATTTLQVMLASEVASSAVTMLAGSNVRISQVA